MINQIGHVPNGICGIVGKVAIVQIVQKSLESADRRTA